MAAADSYLKGKKILAVDDEPDILETIEDILVDSEVDTARDYDSAIDKINTYHYDLAVLDIMGVSGLKLLEATVEKEIPTVMLTAHAINEDTLMESIRKGAISYLPKETLSELDELLNDLLGAYEKGEPPWKLLFDRLGTYFDERFGTGWQDRNRDFWNEFSKTYDISLGIRERLKHDKRILDKGI